MCTAPLAAACRPCWCDRKDNAKLHVEVLRFRVVEHERIGGLLWVQLELLREFHADALRLQQVNHALTEGQIRAGTIAEGVTSATVLQVKEVLGIVGVFRANTCAVGERELGANALVPVLGQRLGELHSS